MLRIDHDAWRDQITALDFAFMLRKPDAMDLAERMLKCCRLDAGERIERRENGKDRVIHVAVQPAVRVLAQKRAHEVAELIERHAKVAPTPVRNLYNWGEYREGTMVLARGTDLGPTPEAFAKNQKISRCPPIPALFDLGRIDAGHVRAAQEIQWVAEGITSKLDARAGSYAPGGGAGGIWRDAVSDKVLDVFSATYKPWVDGQRMRQAEGTRHFDLTMAIVVQGGSLSSVRLSYKMGFDRALEYLRLGLTDYRKAQIERKRDEAHSRQPAQARA